MGNSINQKGGQKSSCKKKSSQQIHKLSADANSRCGICCFLTRSFVPGIRNAISRRLQHDTGIAKETGDDEGTE